MHIVLTLHHMATQMQQAVLIICGIWHIFDWPSVKMDLKQYAYSKYSDQPVQLHKLAVVIFHFLTLLHSEGLKL